MGIFHCHFLLALDVNTRFHSVISWTRGITASSAMWFKVYYPLSPIAIHQDSGVCPLQLADLHTLLLFSSEDCRLCFPWLQYSPFLNVCWTHTSQQQLYSPECHLLGRFTSSECHSDKAYMILCTQANTQWTSSSNGVWSRNPLGEMASSNKPLSLQQVTSQQPSHRFGKSSFWKKRTKLEVSIEPYEPS